MQFKSNPGKEVHTGTVNKQIDVIKKTLICVSSSESSKNVAMLVGTHVDQVESKDVLTKVDKDIDKLVQKFGRKITLVAAEKGGKPENLALKVAKKHTDLCNSANDPEHHTQAVIDIVNNDIMKCQKSEKLPASWYMFIIVLRRLVDPPYRYSVLQKKHCEYIAKKLYIIKSDASSEESDQILSSLLSQLQEVFGIVLFFRDIPGLEDIVICDPGFIYESISKSILKAYDDRFHLPLNKKLTNWGIFNYEKLKKDCKFKQDQLKMDKLKLLLEHLGIITQVHIKTPREEPISDHENGAQNSMIIHHEYLIPCMLDDAMEHDLRVQIQGNQACSIVPLRIYFKCGFAPMGGFCYLFAKLSSENHERWSLCLPDKSNNIYWRNKVSFEVELDCRDYLVTLLSTDEYYEIHVIHLVSRQPFHLQNDGRNICKHVWGAIRTVLEKSPNTSLRAYKVACICTNANQEMDEHVMEFKSKPHENLLNIKAHCKECRGHPPLDMQPSVMVWFKVRLLK